jgi:hypothetical protein
MTSVEGMFHILQQGPKKCTLSFETPNHAIKNISKDIDVTTKKVWTQKQKELEAKNRKTRLVLKL